MVKRRVYDSEKHLQFGQDWSNPQGGPGVRLAGTYNNDPSVFPLRGLRDWKWTMNSSLDRG